MYVNTTKCIHQFLADKIIDVNYVCECPMDQTQNVLKINFENLFFQDRGKEKLSQTVGIQVYDFSIRELWC